MSYCGGYENNFAGDFEDEEEEEEEQDGQYDNPRAMHYYPDEETVVSAQGEREVQDTSRQWTKMMKYALIAGVVVAVVFCILLVVIVVLAVRTPENLKFAAQMETTSMKPTNVAAAQSNNASKEPIQFVRIRTEGATVHAGFTKYSFMCNSNRPSQDKIIDFHWKMSDNIVTAKTQNDYTSSGQQYTVVLQNSVTMYLCCLVFHFKSFFSCKQINTGATPVTTQETPPDGSTKYYFFNIWPKKIHDDKSIINLGFVEYTFECHPYKPIYGRKINYSWRLYHSVFKMRNQQYYSTSSGQTFTVKLANHTNNHLCCFAKMDSKIYSSCLRVTPVLRKNDNVILTAQNIHWTYGNIQKLKIYETGCYQLELLGASGGKQYQKQVVYRGGYGAKVTTKEKISENTTFYIALGKQGQDHQYLGAGGGGGTFVYMQVVWDQQSPKNSSYYELLAAAGGGGGAGYGRHNDYGNGNGQSSTSGAGNQCQSSGAVGGTNGYGGGSSTTSYRAGSGAGWKSDGNAGSCPPYISPSGGHSLQSLHNSWSGGYSGSSGYGGYGGGGGGGCYSSPSNISYSTGGGGGGYSGGNGGQILCSSGQGGGGGGSYCRTATFCTKISGGNTALRVGKFIMTGPLSENC